TEALIYADKAKLNVDAVLKSICTDAAGSWSLDNYAPRINKQDFDPGFATKHFIKDMEIAIESARELNIETHGLNVALDMYKHLAKSGHEEKGIHALMFYYTNV